MYKLKDIDYKILRELLNNSKTSDRQVAKKIGISQPTVTRRRARLERELIDGYTAIPKWEKLGYEILAITLVKTKEALGLKDSYKNAHEKGIKWLMKQPNVLMSGGCRGMGVSGFMISVHKSYSDYDSFMSKHKRELGDTFTDVQTVLVNLGGNQILKPFHLKYLAEAK
ncbi:MAG: Lrp/AsnC family transcriptional regulator [Candidatus Bathyarchaeota archaeon]|nr:Lrp/AsnC family transcriptional regulator [Candidatus Bathyarchaeota archaeon]